MADFMLTQDDADVLLKLEKHAVDSARMVSFPAAKSIAVPLRSTDGREDFVFDLYRGRVNVAKVKYQTRAKKVIVLARIDLGGAPHKNPDGVDVPAPHIHLYREGFDDKWAYPLPSGDFSNPTDPDAVLGEFLAYCNVTKPPILERQLF